MRFASKIKIGNRKISFDSPTFIIAEAGVNHNGDIGLAKRLIDEAVAAGVDAVKFQSFKTEKLILKNIEKAPYQRRTSLTTETQFDMLKRLEFSKHQMEELKKYCEEKQIIFLSTPFEKNSLDELEELGVEAFKIAATDLTNIQFLRQIAEKQKPMILSAGMCYMEEVEKALKAIAEINNRLILLQCTANYPIRDEEANIGIVKTLREKYEILTGYSDHTSGIGASPYAVALGAKVVEKHFTLDKNMEGPDHKASVTPEELKQLVVEIRKVEKYIGNGIKMPTFSEQGTRKSLQKCLVACRDISQGDTYTNENVVAKRTNGEGISALYIDEIIGKRADRDYKEDEIIQV
ncbi:MAG: N-acetylneuraminate synthase [Lachnospiraceae bacterium]|nr:N-acetylneuraminate synthase [Lachnospiraceae bacterium]MBQ3602103.1 N-acetylneuraminate synthase [Lachnospiraceae bacterium]